MSDPSPRARLPLLLALAAAALLLAPSLRGGFVWDDAWLIVRNANIQSLARLPHALTSGFWDISDQRIATGGWQYYRPVITLVYAAAWRLFGEAPAGYHALNLAAHLGCVALASLWFARRFGRDVFEGPRAPAAAIALGLFAVHASRAESVAWIAGCTDVWMTLWMLAAHALWTRGARVGACVAAALACFSKEGAFALPVLMAADIVLGAGEADERPVKERLRALVPLAATMLACLVVRGVLVRERNLGRIAELLPGAPARVVTSLGGYLVRAAVPWPPRAIFRTDLYGSLGSLWGVVGIVAVAGFVALCALAWRRPAVRPWLADALWLLVPLAPVLNLVPMFQCTFIAQRFLYLPVLGLSALLLRALLVADGGPARTASLALAGAFALGHAVALVPSAAMWRDDLTLWTHERAADPGDSYACRQLASQYATTDRQRSLTLSVRCYAEARALGHRSEAQSIALAALTTRLDMVPDGAQAELRVIRGVFDDLLAGRPASFVLYGQRLVVLPRGPGWDALRGDPTTFRFPHAISLLRTGDLVGAERELRSLVQRYPQMSAALGNLALVLGRQQRWGEARGFALRALAARPGDAYLTRLVATLGAGAGLDGIADPHEKAFVRARVMLDLHAPAEAMAALAVFGDDAPPPIVMLRARAAVADGRVGEAVALVEAARARDPAHAVEWDRVLAQLRALRR